MPSRNKLPSLPLNCSMMIAVLSDRLVRLLAVVVLLATVATQAQTVSDSPPRDPAAMIKRIQELTDQLDLTADQRSQIDDIFKHAHDDLLNAAPDLKNASAEDKAGKYREILDDLRQQMAGVLTDEQKQTLQEKIASLRRGQMPPVTTPVTPPVTPTATPTTKPLIPATPASASPQSPPNREPRGGKPGQYFGRLKENLSKLDLTDDQKTKADAALDQLQSQLKELREQIRGGSVPRTDARDKIAAILADGKTKFATILTSDQQEKLRSLMQNTPTNSPTNPPAPTSAPVAMKTDQPPLLTPSPLPSPTGPDAVAPESSSPLDLGQPAPEFKLKRTNGQTVELSSSKHHLLVLVFGSLSAPVLRDHIEALNALRDKYGSRGVDFLVIYTREQHPVGGWELQRNKDQNVNIPLAKTPADRETAAEQLHDSLHLSISIAPDTMDDHTATAYGVNQTVPAFLIDQNSTIAFHQSWLEPNSLARALDDALTAEKRN